MGSGTALKPNLSLSEGQRVGQGGRGKKLGSVCTLELSVPKVESYI